MATKTTRQARQATRARSWYGDAEQDGKQCGDINNSRGLEPKSYCPNPDFELSRISFWVQ